MGARAGAIAVAVLALVAGGTAAAGRDAPETLRFTRAFDTGLRLSSVTWTGSAFLVTEETTGATATVDPLTGRVARGPRLDQGGEELRCVLSPGRHGFPSGSVYCHTPDNRVIRIRPDGTGARLVARLPEPPPSDGAIAFDAVGTFGHRLLVATGGSATEGGALFAVGADGRTALVGRYDGPGGADNIAQAPAGFGRVGGFALLAVDDDLADGRIVAMGPDGVMSELASGLEGGANPIVPVPSIGPWSRTDARVRPGLYLAETFSRDVWFTPLAALRRWAGALLVVAERRGVLWALRPDGDAFDLEPVRTDLRPRGVNFEHGVVVR